MMFNPDETPNKLRTATPSRWPFYQSRLFSTQIGGGVGAAAEDH